ncbi:MAG: heme exporter protein CcmD [Gammaproteobacteria bacterium]|uniref:Heme exporter protein D n=1 Tax=Vreelandella titanicae TaxID=664683 RepID=A0A558JBI1_9GAMM|nr:heme exporter protein CcmD [Halomonas titanicae]MBR9902751.1 heme exporter protein CcmD [Gammaproteobacteria bacterium]TVU90971.1 heme exporter protein CcmD [Halomonas titanicae]
MAFDSLAEFLAMGGHAPYVWSAWGVTALLLLAIVWHARAEQRQLLKGLKRRARRENRARGVANDA